MKTTRTRMMIIFMTAAVVISFFIRWNDTARQFRDFRDGWNDGVHAKR